MQNSAAGPSPHAPTARYRSDPTPSPLTHTHTHTHTDTHTSLFASRIVFDDCVCVFLQIVVCNSLSFVLAKGLSQLCHQQLRQGAEESKA